jgi:ribosomal protein L11 methyltransferase
MLYRYTFRVDPELLDALSGCLFQAGALGLEEGTDSLSTVVEAELGGELCRSYDEFCARVREAFPGFSTSPVDVEEITADYNEGWLAALEPVELLPNLVFCPTTKPDVVEPGKSVLWFEPRPAFGAGEHPTTRLAARAIAAEVKARAGRGVSTERLLDLGTGSGVLSLVSLWLGVKLAVGTDIAEEAILATQVNAKLNGLEARLEVLQTSLPAEDEASFDVIVANIDCETLLETASSLVSRLGTKGALIVTGFLEEDVDTLRAEYEQLGLLLQHQVLDGDWALLHLHKS